MPNRGSVVDRTGAIYEMVCAFLLDGNFTRNFGICFLPSVFHKRMARWKPDEDLEMHHIDDEQDMLGRINNNNVIYISARLVCKLERCDNGHDIVSG